MRMIPRMAILAAPVLALAFVLGRTGLGDDGREDLRKRFFPNKAWYGHVVVVIQGGGTRARKDHRESYSVRREAEVRFRVKLMNTGMDQPGMEQAMEQALAMVPEKDRAEARESLEKMRNERMWFSEMIDRNRKPEDLDDVRLLVNESSESSGEENSCVDEDDQPYNDGSTIEGSDQRKSASTHGLTIDVAKGTYELRLDPKVDELEVTRTEGHSGQPDRKTVGRESAARMAQHMAGSRKLPEEGNVLSGSEPIPREDRPFISKDYGTVTGTISWTLSPDPIEVVELVLKPEGYDDWRPRGGEDEKTEGSTNKMQAILRKRGDGGAPPDVKMKRLAVELQGVSLEPGVCLNRPLEGAAESPDLRFTEERNPGVTIEREGRRLTKKGGEFAELALENSAYDVGAWGTVTANATLTDGRFLKAVLDGDPSKQEVLLPKRSPDSKIADKWKAERGVDGKKDTADDETSPAGDGQPGDGLTLYEEYRGFYVEGRWAEGDDACDPMKKDLFIHNAIGAGVESGIATFRQSTELKVHDRLADDEKRPNRVVNFNSGTPRLHLVDQHCLELREGYYVETASRCMPEDGSQFPGPPKNTKEVRIYPPHLRLSGPQTQVRRGETYAIARVDRTVAHELCHGLGVRHHGEGDTRGSRWSYEVVDGALRFSEDGQPIIVMNERTKLPMMPADLLPTLRPDGTFGAALPPSPMSVVIGEWQGQHSGDEACVMRYCVATAYRSRSDDSVRYYHGGPEIMGNRLCESPAGTGVNDPAHEPQPRYGGADTGRGRGDCKHKFVVRDRWEKKP